MIKHWMLRPVIHQRQTSQCGRWNQPHSVGNGGAKHRRRSNLGRAGRPSCCHSSCDGCRPHTAGTASGPSRSAPLGPASPAIALTSPLKIHLANPTNFRGTSGQGLVDDGQVTAEDQRPGGGVVVSQSAIRSKKQCKLISAFLMLIRFNGFPVRRVGQVSRCCLNASMCGRSRFVQPVMSG
jgi:hypothetical protein